MMDLPMDLLLLVVRSAAAQPAAYYTFSAGFPKKKKLYEVLTYFIQPEKVVFFIMGGKIHNIEVIGYSYTLRYRRRGKE